MLSELKELREKWEERLDSHRVAQAEHEAAANTVRPIDEIVREHMATACHETAALMCRSVYADLTALISKLEAENG